MAGLAAFVHLASLSFTLAGAWPAFEQSWPGVFNVRDFNAKGDGIQNDTPAFENAWKMACAFESSVVLVPAYYTFLVGPTYFSGPCKANLTMQVDGTIIAPANPEDWQPVQRNSWLGFIKLSSFSVTGNGTIDGRGQTWWSISCKRNKVPGCSNEAAPTALWFYGSNNITLHGFKVQNSQQMNVAFVSCTNVNVKSLRVQCPGDSPNTDGIHVELSRNVLIEHSAIGTGDDCVSIGSGSSNIVIKNSLCGPGHGISVGSLGKDESASYVSDILVHRLQLTGTTNGLRIKTWQGGQGSASGIRFENVTMTDVANPIIIDQYYCDSPHPCGVHKSAVQVSNVTYLHVSGTSATEVATSFSCSPDFPCRNLFLDNIRLVKTSGAQASANCANAFGTASGTVVPASCLW